MPLFGRKLQKYAIFGENLESTPFRAKMSFFSKNTPIWAKMPIFGDNTQFWAKMPLWTKILKTPRFWVKIPEMTNFGRKMSLLGQ